MPFATRQKPEPTARPTLPSARPLARAAVRWLVVFVACLHGPWPAPRAAEFDTPVTATWNGVGLWEWAGRLSRATGVPVVVDRRLDPDIPIRLDCRDEPLVDVVGRGAAAAGGEVAVLRSALCIVPIGRAAVMLRAEAARDSRAATLPARERAALATRRRLAWTAGERPRDLVTAAATQAGVVVRGLESVPHDHLAALDLPELTLAERLDLLLAAFDLRVDWQPPAGGRKFGGAIIAIDADLPPIATTATRSATKPARPRVPAASKPGTDSRSFSMQVAAPLDELLATIAPRLGLNLDIDRVSLERAGVAPGEIVRATVTDASRDELLEAILAPLGLASTITGDTLRVHARDR